MPQMRVTGAADLERLARMLQGPAALVLKAELQEGLRSAVAPVGPAAKAAILAAPDRNPQVRSDGLRRRIAGAIRTRTLVSASGSYARVYINARQLGDSDKGMPAAFDEAGGWRHPVFGHADRWVTQTGAPGWWTGTVARHAPRARQQVVDAVERAGRRIEKGL